MPTRVVLADVPEPLRDELERDLARDPGLVIISVSDHLEVLLAVGEAQADVVVLGMQGDHLPGIATHLAEEFPSLRIVTIRADGRRVRVYEFLRRLVQVGEVSTDELTEAVTVLIRSRD